MTRAGAAVPSALIRAARFPFHFLFSRQNGRQVLSQTSSQRPRTSTGDSGRSPSSRRAPAAPPQHVAPRGPSLCAIRGAGRVHCFAFPAALQASQAVRAMHAPLTLESLRSSKVLGARPRRRIGIPVCEHALDVWTEMRGERPLSLRFVRVCSCAGIRPCDFAYELLESLLREMSPAACAEGQSASLAAEAAKGEAPSSDRGGAACSSASPPAPLCTPSPAACGRAWGAVARPGGQPGKRALLAAAQAPAGELAAASATVGGAQQQDSWLLSLTPEARPHNSFHKQHSSLPNRASHSPRLYTSIRAA